MPLSTADRESLALAVTPFRYRGELENVIRDRFGESPTQFWQRVNALLSDPAAMESDPIAVRILSARRDRAIATRTRARVA